MASVSAGALRPEKGYKFFAEKIAGLDEVRSRDGSRPFLLFFGT